jgi:serine/threonine protein kinase
MLRFAEAEKTENKYEPEIVSQAPLREKWPDAVAYQEAIQHPEACLDDPHLFGATVAVNRRGLPLAYTGRFAVVFRLTTRDSNLWALRCFTSSPEGEAVRSLRYAAIAPRLAEKSVAHLFVPFRYLPDGIKVGRTCYPALSMGWAAGEPIGAWVEKNRNNPAALLNLAATLSEVHERLMAAGIAHGDWQHDNILVTDEGRRVTLVDYDGMYVPELATMPPAERGHPNYQNPNRQTRDYGPDIDKFSCLLIQTALVALAVEPTLWDSFCDGDALVFHQSDLEDPARSDAFATVRLIAEQEKSLVPLLRALEEACWTGGIPEAVPRTIFDTIATRRGVTLSKPISRPAASPLTSAVSPEEEIVNAPLVTIGKEAEIRPIVTAGKLWLDKIRSVLHRQKVREWTHRIGTLTFFGAMTVLWVDPALITFGSTGDAFGFRFMSFFFIPAGTAVAYFLWPRNLDGIEITEAKEQNDRSLENNFVELKRSSHSFHELNRDPRNLSAVAFVAAALKSVTVDSCSSEINLSHEEWDTLRSRNIQTLADISVQSLAGMSGAAREQLLSLRQTAMQEARNAYEQISHVRRALQRETEQLDRERQGLLQSETELNNRLATMGEENLFQFVASLFRF